VVVLALLWPSTVAVMVTNTGPTPLGGATPSDVGLAYEDVSMVTADGVRLDGWYVAPSDGAVVVLRHGSGSNRATLLDHAAVLAGAGYGVLAVDARGHGSSGGDGMDLGWYGAADTSAAVDLLLTRPEVDPSRIAVLGLSMGGEEAITAAGADGRIAAVVAEGATRRVAADDLWLPRHPGGWLQRAMDRWRDLLADRLTAAPPPPALHDAIVDAGSTPVLLIAAGTVPDEGSTAEHLAAAGEDVVVWEVPGADHTGALAADPSGWRARVVAFLDRALAS
jgi:pimeloyl-ACP methyl ester carboxylesterase